MEKKITCFIKASDQRSMAVSIESLKSSGVVSNIIVIYCNGIEPFSSDSQVTFMKSDDFTSTSCIKMIAGACTTDYLLIIFRSLAVDIGNHSLLRMKQVCESTGAGMVYSDYYENKEGAISPHPVIDYQEGSLRDDFNFGSLLLFKTSALKEACKMMNNELRFAGLYDLRLKVSQKHILVHIPELLYSVAEPDTRESGEKQFDYVDPRNREVQIEMEQACTEHLKKINCWLNPQFEQISFRSEEFGHEASVIIPVRNRAKTVGDAIMSVLSQKTKFKFNLIVIDNHSTDGTTDIIKSFAKSDKRVVHLIPSRKDLGIGGCWNEGIFHKKCGRFAIQLDSDDLYIDNNVIETLVTAFYNQNCAMVVGSYKMVNFNLEDIPPGLIDHKEWTPENGRNNALRINGLGAPRAFYTPLLRSITVPNVSYGEDYAVGLAISRNYRIGRIYEPLYLCRRWEDNSDAALDINKTNLYNLYKDKIRTIELMSRRKMLADRKKKLSVKD